MKKNLKQSILLVSLLLFQTFVFGQALNLGVLSSFEGYTGAGNVSHAGAVWTGDVGTNAGTTTGTYTGNVYNGDAITAQSRFDLMRLYINLNELFVTYPGTHAAAFGGGETIPPGVYSIPSAGSIGGTLTLDGGGNPNAFFVIKFLGAMTVGVSSTVALINGAQSCNVFWIAEESISLAASTNIKGTLFAHLGAVGLGAGAILEGRMLTMSGAITTGVGSKVSAPSCASSIEIACGNECVSAPEVDVLGSVSNFVLFTGLGAVANTGISGVFGDVGSDNGIISGFTSQIHVGNEYAADAVAGQTKIDLDLGYLALMALPNTVTAHPATFGLGEIISPGVYSSAAAGSLVGTITLDGGGDSNAVFVFKFGGAFTVGAVAKVILTNGTKYCNVFWIGGAGVASGSVSIGASAIMKGTIISHGGSCLAGAGVFIEGRMLSTAGAVSTNTSIIYASSTCITSTLAVVLPIELLNFTAVVEDGSIHFNWATATEIENDYFTVERSADAINFTSIGAVKAAGNSTQILYYSTVDDTPLNGKSYYRLKQTDYDGETSISKTEAVEYNNMNDFYFEIYPNPNDGLNLNYRLKNNNNREVLAVFYNVLGKEIYSKVIVTSEDSEHGYPIDPSKKLKPGVYLIIATSGNEIYKKRLIVK